MFVFAELAENTQPQEWLLKSANGSYNVNSRFLKNMRKHSKAIRMSLFSGHDRFHVVITCPGTNAIGKNRLTGSTLPDRHIVVVNRIQ